MGAAKKRVAVIGAGPSGLITIDALAQEKAFDVIRVFERREAPGGCWIAEGNRPVPNLSDFEALAARAADPPLPVPDQLPAQTGRSPQPRFSESSVYPYLETNVDDVAMSFSQEAIPDVRSKWSVGMHGPDTPFRHWTVIRDYLQSLVERNGYGDLVSYNTTVERAEKIGEEWKVTLRREGEEKDEWWEEWFDAVVVASGHYSVPYIPKIQGLEDFARERPGSVIHSKHFRGREAYRDKRVIVVGASVSGADITVDLTKTAKTPVYAVVVGRNFNGYFGDTAFQHPKIDKRPSILRIDGATRTVHFEDGTSVSDVDHLIFGTGFSWTIPFLPGVKTRNNRVPDLYQHTVYRHDPSLLFVGAVGAGLTFKIFEWQAVLAARILSGRARLPPTDEQEKWEVERIRVKGDGPKFPVVYPDFEEYFETVRDIAGPGENGFGRQLPPYDPSWFDRFMAGHELRKAMWRRENDRVLEELSGQQNEEVLVALDEKSRATEVEVHQTLEVA
ncbi:hypothetical protein BKA67DRAFT_622899 [Truncatella angustata]|uniref:Flavin-containing monooxygenase n=1 Tax=Truncatella angustata TaxID=152316 RepID=A0A9P8UKS2_9PEZI|nr:uncharacterized protein BKA67DRAFT_622899 [Truncatella angustata]KAH6653919.1 hypothetical protein BKA67DRAFT_622899 [Truncatella angustata]KAH8194599.1 hypothetical protein TruAng_011232 [Truncatella angustata]